MSRNGTACFPLPGITVAPTPERSTMPTTGGGAGLSSNTADTAAAPATDQTINRVMMSPLPAGRCSAGRGAGKARIRRPRDDHHANAQRRLLPLDAHLTRQPITSQPFGLVG